MHILHCNNEFARWREQARQLLLRAVPPHAVIWEDQEHGQLFGNEAPLAEPVVRAAPRVPPSLLKDLELAAQYRVAGRWGLLYRVLWRVAHGERAAMLAGDPDGSQLQKRIKAVSREAHHLHAFVRFHPVMGRGGLDYVATHEPAHDVLASASLHFAERLGRQRWMIVSSRDAVWYDGQVLHYRQPCPADWAALAASVKDHDDPLWQTYYSSIYNPARLNPKVMQGHMPLRFWAGLSEGRLIPRLISRTRAGAQRDGQAEAVSAKAGKVIRSPAR
ncbi:TIGR03915 family putative DNA repair protein [Halopseudomonas sabulinigri]|uniref:Probable DNA metabolism protein n=2 Tax=Halopseudomonas sabulinigri TaxID=472181 RepID=A0A1H1TAL4_9GAMM|nr:TIGR03915 family putative DNA repair protein [Halopseudomonas sabulinigri]SDS57213.1 probable DNA metabolism protein [Halopseudomonas sabulinigri]